jgi:DNA-binding GntR family transcriptional regulator
MAGRHALHAAIIDAVEDRDRGRALALVADHNTSNPPHTTTPAKPRRDPRLG